MAIPLVLAALLACQVPAAQEAPDPYPPVRPVSHVFYFTLEGKLRDEPLQKALSELSTPSVACRFVRPPRSTAERPDVQFVLVEVPAAVGPKEVAAALRKGANGTQLLVFTCFRASNGRLGGSEAEVKPGLLMRDLMLGMSKDLSWFDEFMGWRQFDYPPGRLDAKALGERYDKYMRSRGGGEIGKLAEEEFRWTLVEPVDPKAVERAVKALQKLPGIARCVFDAAQRALTVGLRFESLESSGPPREFGDKPMFGDKTPVRPRFDTLPVFEILDKEKLTVEPGPAPAAPK